MDANQMLVFGLATVASGGALYAAAYPWLTEDRAGKRQKLIYAGQSGPRTTVNPRETALRRGQVADSLKELERRQKNLRNPPLSVRLEQAGLYWSPRKFYVASAILGTVLGFVAYVATFSAIVAGAVLVLGALVLPRRVLKYITKKRQKAFVKEFPNAIDIIVRGVKSGLPLGDCFRIVSTESQEPVKTEFRSVIEMQTVGMPLGEAVERLYTRLGLPEVNFFAIVIAIQSKAGGNLSEALGNLALVLRERAKMRGKIQAMSMEAKASGWIIGSLPVVVGVMVYVVSPEYISLLWSRTMGIVLLCIAGFWMACGIFAMKKMINFDF